MYLNNIITQTQHAINRLLLIANQPKVEKVLNNILLEYDNIHSEILINPDKIIMESSQHQNKGMIEFYKKYYLFKELFYYRNDNNLQKEILSKIIISEFSELSIRSDRLKFCFEDISQELRKSINNTISIKVEIFKSSLKDYLEALYIYDHYDKVIDLESPTNKSLILKEELFLIDQKKIIKLFQDYQIIDKNNKWSKNFLIRVKDPILLIIKLKELEIFDKKHNDSQLCKLFDKMFGTQINTGLFSTIQGNYIQDYIKPEDKKVFDKLSFLDKLVI